MLCSLNRQGQWEEAIAQLEQERRVYVAELLKETPEATIREILSTLQKLTVREAGFFVIGGNDDDKAFDYLQKQFPDKEPLESMIGSFITVNLKIFNFIISDVLDNGALVKFDLSHGFPQDLAARCDSYKFFRTESGMKFLCQQMKWTSLDITKG
ncbi:MAG: hypothetical protein HUU08_00120 [Candidatus Brocadia sp.]|nr:hypothetical protein [Candidatus Brocadia sp.]